MSASAELPFDLEAQEYDLAVLGQHCYQPDPGYWLTLESPIARAFSFSSAGRNRSPPETFTATAPYTPNQDGSDSLPVPTTEPTAHDMQIHESLPHLHISEFESSYVAIPDGLRWPQMDNDRMMYGQQPYSTSTFHSPIYDIASPCHLQAPVSPYSSPSFYGDSPVVSPSLCSTASYPVRSHAYAPRSLPQDDRDIEYEEHMSDGKPYARLIYEALCQAPGHRMMLRDIYEWFEQNTNKARESGSNGWQNSIRHNLSMNKAFENDKTQCTNARGEPKKATSIWSLTNEALMHGVQSTTRYRKTGGVRKSGLGGNPDYRRQRSGAKGGRAAKRAARLRRLEQHHSDWAPHARSEQGISAADSLTQAATYATQQYSANRDSSPGTPPESFPYTPRSPTQRLDYGLYNASGRKLDGTGARMDDVQGPEILFQQPFESGIDSSW